MEVEELGRGVRDVTGHPGYILRDLLYRERQKRDAKTGCSFGLGMHLPSHEAGLEAA
jgi:hypothetical protein